MSFRSSSSPTLLLLSASLFAGTADAQDISYQPFGNAGGTPFDHRAPANERVGSITVNSGAFLDGLRLNYEGRDGTATTSSPQIGSMSGIADTFVVPDGDYLHRVELWFEPSIGFLRGVTLTTSNGASQTYGLQIGSFSQFQAAPDREIVGLLGTSGQLVQSLGVTTRPVLASHVKFGTACNGSLGAPQIQYRPGFDELQLGDFAIVEVTNVPQSVFGIMFIGFATLPPGGVPLAVIGAPGCTAYVSPDIVQLVGVEPNGAAGTTIAVPNNSAILGEALSFQGGVPSAPNAFNLAVSNAMTCMIGAL